LARLERELDATRKRVGKIAVDQSVAGYELQKHIKQSQPAVEIHVKTIEASFAVKDLDPDAVAAWRDFCGDLVAGQQHRGASLQIIDPTSSLGLTIGHPVRKSAYHGA
jgi:hypothetical protein